MTYIDYINSFWIAHDDIRFSNTEISVFFYLLKVANSFGWEQPFKISDTNICLDLGISLNTFKKARGVLVNAELLEYTSGNGRKNSSSYKVKGINKGSQILTPFINKGISKGSPKLTPFAEKEKNPPSTPLIKEKEKEKTKDNSLSNSRTCVIVEEETLSQDNLPYPLEQLTQCIRQRHQSWIETFCMNNNISLTIFNTLSDIFCTELQNRGDTSKTIKDYKHHFASWYKIQKDRQNATTSTNRQSSRSYQRQQQTRQRQAEIINTAQQLDALFEGNSTGAASVTSVPASDNASDLLQPESSDYPFG